MQAARGASLSPDEAQPQEAPPRGSSRYRLFATVAVLALLLDQVTKVLAVRELTGRDPVEVLGSVLRLNLIRNPGAAFSAGTSLTPVIATFALVVLVVVLVLGTRVGTTGWAWALGLLAAGVAGNLTDRLFREPGPLRGHVVDFLELPHWPIFNVADICINVAAGLIIVQSLRGIPMRGTAAEGDA